VRLRATLLTCTVAALLVSATPAWADVFGPIELVSQGVTAPGRPSEQADYAHHPVVSGDGQFVAFDGSVGGVKGVWRRDLASDTIEQVAPGDAQLPSISQDGRYVSFTTNEKLVPGDQNEGPDVYVRDMDIHSSAPCTQEMVSEGSCPFELISAVNGDPEEALTYASSSPKEYGSLAAGRSAMSANGQYVAFVTTAESNLDGPATPTMQVAVRNRVAKHTELVSALIDPATGRPKTTLVDGEEQDEPVPTEEEGTEAYGAVYPGGSNLLAFPLRPKSATTVGASISADGSTVAWMGQDIYRQAPVLAEELSRLKPNYAEPLWRKVDEGPSAPIRRITGGSDPTSPACVASGATELPQENITLLDPCQGPFAIEGEADTGGLWARGPEGVDALPQLSEHGDRVAILVDAREVASGEEFGSSNDFSDDLYVVNMAEGLTRVQALTRLTEIAGSQATEVGRTAPIADFDISPNGNEVAFATQRTVFPLGSPAFISEPIAFPGMVELYDADLSNDTLTRVSHGFEGEAEPANQPHGITSPGVDPYDEAEGVFSPSFSADGTTLAFSSTASNLVFGDGNAPPDVAREPYDGSNSYVVSLVPFEDVPVAAQISSAPANPAPTPTWSLGVSALSRHDGSVLLDVEVPGQGSLSAGARSQVVVVFHSRAAHGAAGHTKVSAHRSVATRTVASHSASARASEVVPVVLDLARPYSGLAAAHGGLSASVHLTFTAAGHASISASIRVRFVRPPSAKKPKSHAARRKHPTPQGHGGG
jgi:hypothetical protein